jgi:hypothetical protein
MKKNTAFDRINELFTLLKKYPTLSNLNELRSAMQKAGANYKNVKGMPKEFAAEFIHGHKRIKQGDLEKKLRKAFQSTQKKDAGLPSEMSPISNEHSARINFSTELNTGPATASS